MKGVDVAVATPAFVDMTFVGLEALPALGEERFAGEVVHSPGGGAITAIGCARLGLATAMASPIGDDPHGRLIRGEMEREGVAVTSADSVRTPVTMVMPVDGERSMVTYDPGVRASAADLAALAPRAVVCGLEQLDLVPPGAHAYVSCGDYEARAHAGTVPASLSRARALTVNLREAQLLTGTQSPEEAAARLAETVCTVVVTLGPEGAVAIVEGRPLRTPGVEVGSAIDTTGAGDLLAAAWVWADASALDPEARLRWAVLYAALSVTVPTGAAGAAHLRRFLEEGTRRGLPAPHLRKGVMP